MRNDMTRETMMKLEALDNAVDELADGAYVLPMEVAPDYDVRKILDYCKERGVSPSSLTDKELARFIRQTRSHS
jgi:hypothetical protein